jgi:prepilin-type N-terminal cleavage/methylation domain-containing protein
MKRKKSKFKKGFTIIELIVVISIIAVLATIVLANVTQYISKAKLERANADIKNIEKALIAFNAQYGD